MAHDHSHDAHVLSGGHNPAYSEPGVEVHPSNKAQIWRVFFILLGITIVELAIAFIFPGKEGAAGVLKMVVFFALTVLKAFYIVAYFMHLKFEKINLIYSIIVPMIFVIYIIGMLLYEAGYWADIRP